MKTITTIQDYLWNLTILNKIINDPDVKYVGKRIQERLEKHGFTLVCLGSGHSSRTSSKQLIDRHISSYKYANGWFVGVGISNVSVKRGQFYYGFVKQVKIKDDNGNLLTPS